MGLLEKIINKQIQEEKKTYTRAEIQSLLRKAEQVLTGGSDNIRIDKKKTVNNFTSAIKDFKKKKKNLSVPLDIFNLFLENFKLTKGALFILNQASENFTVWALAGYDYTTANRLRIPDHDAKDIFGEERKSILLNGNLLQKISKYFSSREFSNLNSALFIPFFTRNNDLFAFLMFSQSIDDDETFSDILSHYDVFYSTINSALLHFFTTIKINPNHPVFIQQGNTYNAIKDAIEKYGYSNLFVVFFNSSKFLNYVSGIIDTNFKNNFYNNIIDIFSSFISNNGNIFIIDNNTISILKDAPSLSDKDMITHQISFFIRNLVTSDRDNKRVLEEQKIKDLIRVFHLPKENDALKQFLND
ncbi:MAG: hypothetical protein FWC36_02375 [Spirochaetes bacterium]|nr:hypothetical protein [Spirochaetota bacterium]